MSIIDLKSLFYQKEKLHTFFIILHQEKYPNCFINKENMKNIGSERTMSVHNTTPG